jgi:Ser/Thr protein kinase RdoA (MazF antagonist)
VTAADVDAFCARELGSRVERREFTEAGVATVFGLRLRDRRRVVVKVHRADTTCSRLEAGQIVQRHLAESGFPCPVPLAGPAPLGTSLATAESLLDVGERADPHEPALRAEMARALAELVELGRGLVGLGALGGAPGPLEPLWGTPHDDRFDFGSTSAGAEWIDELAREARGRLAEGELVLGHVDWRAENMRFDAGRVSAVYDWDSLALAPEPVVVGAASHYFPSDFRVEARRQLPTLDEALAFVGDYESARGSPFTGAELRGARAALVDAMAYTARCEHSDALTDFGRRPPISPRRNLPAGSARAFLRAHGPELLAG